MAYNNKVIKRDQRQNPVPQIFNAEIDDYQALEGKDGAQYVAFKGAQEVKLPANNLKDLATGDLTVTTTPIEIKAGVSPLANRKQIMIYAPSAGTIYWGKSGVTSATGLPLIAGSQPIIIEVDSSSPKLYAVSDGTNRTVKVAEFS